VQAAGERLDQQLGNLQAQANIIIEEHQHAATGESWEIHAVRHNTWITEGRDRVTPFSAAAVTRIAPMRGGRAAGPCDICRKTPGKRPP
jgi:hypothetical protein